MKTTVYEIEIEVRAPNTTHSYHVEEKWTETGGPLGRIKIVDEHDETPETWVSLYRFRTDGADLPADRLKSPWMNGSVTAGLPAEELLEWVSRVHVERVATEDAKVLVDHGTPFFKKRSPEAEDLRAEMTAIAARFPSAGLVSSSARSARRTA